MHRIFGFRAFSLELFAMLPDLFTSVALAVLLYLSVKYQEYAVYEKRKGRFSS